MSNKDKETMPNTTKVFVFFNYNNIISNLHSHLSILEAEYKKLNGGQEYPSSKNISVSIDTNNHSLKPNNPVQNRKLIIEELRQNIQNLEDELTRLRNTNSNLSESPPHNLSASDYLSNAIALLEEGKIFDALESANNALQVDLDILNTCDSSFPSHIDIVQIVTNTKASVALFEAIEASEVYSKCLNANMYKEYILKADDKARFLESIDQYKAMYAVYDKREQEPLLLVAARFRYLNIIKWLLTKGIPVDIESNDGRTALNVAAYYGYDEIIDLLIDSGADSQHQCKIGITSLTYAAINGHLTTVECLIEDGIKSGKKIDLDSKDQNDITALMFASQNGHTPVVECLLRGGAKAGIRTNKGLFAIDFAVVFGHLDIIQLLIDQMTEEELQMHDLDRLIVRSAGRGHLNILKLLQAAGANVEAVTIQTPLMRACQEGHTPVIEYLVEECKVNVNQLGEKGVTALMCASWANTIDAVQYLIDHEADLNLLKENETALTIAAGEGNREIVALLLSRGAITDNLKESAISAEGLALITEELSKLPKTQTLALN